MSRHPAQDGRSVRRRVLVVEDDPMINSLSADAVPELLRLSEAELDCALPGGWSSDDDWLAWSLGRERARDAVGAEELPARGPRTCRGDVGVSAP